MPRRPRPHAPGQLHHLISRFTNRERRMRGAAHRDAYLERLARATNRCDARPSAYGLMSTHTHLAVLNAEDPIGALLHPLNTAFGRWWNKHSGGLGRVFAERPRSIVLSTEESLARLIAYIHNNPGRAGLVDDPTESSWTSHRAFVGLDAAPPWLCVEWTLAAMGFSSLPSGRASFHAYVCSRARLPRDPALAGPGPLGHNFLDALLRAVAEHAGLAPEEVRRPVGDKASQARKRTVAVAIDILGASGKQLAMGLGLSPTMVSRLRRDPAAGLRSTATQEILDRFLELSAHQGSVNF